MEITDPPDRDLRGGGVTTCGDLRTGPGTRVVNVRPPNAGTEQHLLDAARVLLTDGPDLPPEAT